MRRRTVVLLFTFSLGHVLIISAQVQSRSGVPVIQAVGFGVFAGIQHATGSVADAVRSLWTNYVALHGAAKENDDLRRRIVELEGQLQQLQAVGSTTRALEDALGLQRSLTVPTRVARVIAGDPSPGAPIATVTIDRGADDGISTDMAVMSAEGVVGRIINRPTSHAAQVQLLVDRTAAAGAVLERTSTGGIVRGVGSPPLQMNYVSNLADVQPNERVLTSGQDGIFPRGFVIGTVERADRGRDLYREITVRPAVDFSHLDVVIVVLIRPVKPGGGSS